MFCRPTRHVPTFWIAACVLPLAACGTSPSSPTPITPQPIVDQAYELHSASDIGFDAVGGMDIQTFTVSVSGRLTGADLILNGGITGLIAPDPCAGGVSFSAQVLATSPDGTPSSQILTNGDVPSSQLPLRHVGDAQTYDFKHVDFSPPIDVVAGTVLGLTGSFSGFRCGDIFGAGSPVHPSAYLGGSVFIYGGIGADNRYNPAAFTQLSYLDYFFRTYVVPKH